MKPLSLRATKIINVMAQDEARQKGSSQIFPEHVVLAILKNEDCLGNHIFNKIKIEKSVFINELKSFFEKTQNLPTLDEIPKSRRFQVMLDLAEIESNSLHNDYVGTEHLVLAAVREAGSFTFNFFNDKKIFISDFRNAVLQIQKEEVSSASSSPVNFLFKSLFEADELDDFSKFNESLEEAKKMTSETKKNQNKTPFLNEYCTDLTAEAENKKLDFVIGREKEIQKMIQILSRRTKNNPVLTGEPGVGKTAIVEGFAQHIVEGKVPENLLNKRIYSLDVASLVAGTKYRGEFEERIKKIIRELQKNPEIIIFIDEIHNLVGAGGFDGPMNASNILKPALSSKEIQLIGATTTKEYTKYIEKDAALERRLQVIKVEEPDDENTKLILKGVKKHYEEFHNVSYSDEVLSEIIKLSGRYVPEKVFPDKAIDILDESGAAKKIESPEKTKEICELEKEIENLTEKKNSFVKIQDYENAALARDKLIDLKKSHSKLQDEWKNNFIYVKKTVTKEDVGKIISEITGIPCSKMNESETERLINLEKELKSSVIGQDEAVKIISGAVRRSRVGLSCSKQPSASFIFLGPTGVGKTQLAKSLAKSLFGTEDSLIRIDMSDYMEKHNAARLTGSPPGYIGYEEGGILTEKVRRHPYSVILFDEIEKAHPSVFNLFLQILEEGELSDNLGHNVNFKNTVIIMTSNAGSQKITNEGKVGFGINENILSKKEIRFEAMNELKKFLSPEFLNRIDDVIVFNPLSENDIRQILQIQLSELSKRLSEKEITVNVLEDAKSYLVKKGYNPSMGARPMRRLIRMEIEDPLSEEILKFGLNKKCVVNIDCKNEKLKISVESVQEEKTSKEKIPELEKEKIKALK